MKRLLATALLVLIAAPVMAERYENTAYTRPLFEYCVGVAGVAGTLAGYRDDGFKEQALLTILRRGPANTTNPRLAADNEVNLTMVYHYGGWMMSTPDQIAQGAFENCMAQHGSETWWHPR